MKVLPSYNLNWLEKKLTFGFGNSSSIPAGPQSKADIAAGGFRPKGTKQTKAGNPNIAKKQGAYASSTPAAIVNKQTADRNTMRRADASIRRRTKPSLLKLNDNSYLSTLG